MELTLKTLVRRLSLFLYMEAVLFRIFEANVEEANHRIVAYIKISHLIVFIVGIRSGAYML